MRFRSFSTVADLVWVAARRPAGPGACEEIRRSYSICQPPFSAPPGTLRIVVKQLGPGSFGEYAVSRLEVGDTLEVGPPKGSFTLADHPGAHHVLIGGGSGITPLMSMATTALHDDPECRVSLVHANRTARSILLAEEVADLKDRYDVLKIGSRTHREAGMRLLHYVRDFQTVARTTGQPVGVVDVRD
ncbi:hypothetical protein [Streptomyces sp. NPDC003374]